MANPAIHRSADRNPTLGFLRDISEGLARWELWRTFAVDEIQQRYRRSYLGVLWILVSYAMFVGGISVIFSAFTSESSESFIIHVAIGYAAFMFIIGNMLDGCDVFIRSANWIKSISLPYSSYVYRSIFRSLFAFSLQLCVAFAVMLATGWLPGPLVLFAIPAFLVYLLNAVAVQYLAGLVSARYRDFPHFVSAVTRLLFFVTPILWVRGDMDGPRSYIADLNPLAHYLEIFRAPLMNQPPSLLSWVVVLGCTAAVWIAVTLVATRLRRRLAYWL